MTTEELIIGHYDGTLTTEQEHLLQQTIASSAEARSLYDTHGGIHRLLAHDVAAAKPSESLNRKVVAASLLAVPELIGAGATAWVALKVVGGVSAVVFGGIAVVSLLTSTMNDRHDVRGPSTSTPVVRQGPAFVPLSPPVLPGMEEALRATFGGEDQLKQASDASSPQRSKPQAVRGDRSDPAHNASGPVAPSLNLRIDDANATKASPKVRTELGGGRGSK